MTDQELLNTYNEVSQEDHNEFEAMYELITDDVDIPSSELKRALSYFILKTYLLENNLINKINQYTTIVAIGNYTP